MATLTPTLTLTSTDASSDSLALSVTDSLTVGNPAVSVARQEVSTSGQFNILTAAANTGISYVYVKNIDSTNIITLKDDSANNLTSAPSIVRISDLMLEAINSTTSYGISSPSSSAFFIKIAILVSKSGD